MMKFFGRKVFFIAFILITSHLFSAGIQPSNHSPAHREEITVVITDSGLGGLAVMDVIAKKISKSGHYKRVSLVFVNALFEADQGYNALSTREEKIAIFNDVLSGIERTFQPDVILIACNTLSVIYRDTPFVQNSGTEVVGIVEPGVKLIEDALADEENSVAIITGTETTISEDSHRKALIQKGFPESRIITQSCPQLQSYIEQDPMGEDTEMLIAFYVDEAVSKLPDGHGSVYLSLNCSHYGYSEPLWKRAFEYTSSDLSGVLNPNLIMGDVLMPEDAGRRYSKTRLTMKVVSKVELRNRDAMCNLFSDSSPELTKALNNYDLVQDLF